MNVGLVMRLLLVEDEEKTSTYLSRALGESGFTVDVVAGLKPYLNSAPDVRIFDVM